MNDDELLTAVREQRTKVPMTVPVEQVISRGRAVRARRRIPAAVGGLAVVSATAVVLGLGLSGALGSARSTGTTRTADFTLVEHANGTVTLTINPRVLLEPTTLQSDLRQDGIPALVTTGSFCCSDPIPAGFPQVVTMSQLPAKQLIVTINPAAMPAGTEVSFGSFQYYSDNSTDTAIELIDTNSNTCASTPPAPPPDGNGILVTGPLSGDTTWFEAPGS
jgi:hypothetical protein